MSPKGEEWIISPITVWKWPALAYYLSLSLYCKILGTTLSNLHDLHCLSSGFFWWVFLNTHPLAATSNKGAVHRINWQVALKGNSRKRERNNAIVLNCRPNRVKNANNRVSPERSVVCSALSSERQVLILLQLGDFKHRTWELEYLFRRVLCSPHISDALSIYKKFWARLRWKSVQCRQAFG